MAKAEAPQSQDHILWGIFSIQRPFFQKTWVLDNPKDMGSEPHS